MEMNLTLPWCVYRSTHPSGLFYEGKGQTEKVLAGTYKGSGIRFKLALTHPGFSSETWTTIILGTFKDEETSFEAEALQVPIESLSNPMRLNMMAGGRAGKFQNHSKLFKMQIAAKKAEAKVERQAKAKLKALKQKQRENDFRKRIRDLQKGKL